MAFPDEDLTVLVEAAFGADLTADPATWVWTDLTDRLMPTTISVARGVAIGAASAQVSSGSVMLTNEDGWLTPKLPTSPYWPDVDVATPMRVRVLPNTFTLADTFGRTTSNGWGGRWSTSGDAGMYSTTGSQARLTLTGPGLARSYSDIVAADVDVVFDCGVNATTVGQAHTAGVAARIQPSGEFVMVVAEFQPSGVVDLNTTVFVDGDYRDLRHHGSTGVTYTPGGLVRVRVQVAGNHMRVKVWPTAGTEPATWHMDVYQATVTAPGQLAMHGEVITGNGNGNPRVITFDNVTITRAPNDRLEGYITDVRPTFQPTGDGETWSTVAIDIGGVGSRLEKNDAPAESPVRRSVSRAQIGPVAYWPLEDGEGATYGVSAIQGHPRMIREGPATFGYSLGIPEELHLTRYGSRPLVSVAPGARLSALVPLSPVSTEWSVVLTAQVYAPHVPGVSEVRIMQWHTPHGSLNRWALINTATGYQVRCYNDLTGYVANVVTDNLGGFYNVLTTFEVDAYQDGANIRVNMRYNSGPDLTGTVAGTMGAVSKVVLNPDRTNTTASVTPGGLRFVVGHARVYDDIDAIATPFYYQPDLNMYPSADTAWYREPAHIRLLRLCEEERVPFGFYDLPPVAEYTPVGAQQDGSFLELTEAATEAESGGLLVEDGFGFAYLARALRYNRPVAMTIDLATYARSADISADSVLVPQLESRAANVWTVERTDGGSGTYAAPAAYRSRRGTIAEEITLDVLRDEDTEDHAAWRVHLNIDGRGAEYPDVTIDLVGNPELIDAWLSCSIGSRIQRINQPTVAGVGVIDQVIEGTLEQLAPRMWQVTCNTSAADVWNVGVAGDAALGKADTDGSTTRATTSTATTILVDVTAGPRWTTDTDEMPLYVSALGEDMRVTAVSGFANPQSFTVVRALNGVSKALSAGTPISLTNPARAAL